MYKVSGTQRRVDTIRQKQCTGIGSLKVFNAVQLWYRIHNSSRWKYTNFRQNSETGKLGIKVIHEETRSTITAGTLLTRKTRRTDIRGKRSTAYIHIRAGRQQDTGEHKWVITTGWKRTKGGSKHRDNTRGDGTIKIKQEVNETKTSYQTQSLTHAAHLNMCTSVFRGIVVPNKMILTAEHFKVSFWSQIMKQKFQ